MSTKRRTMVFQEEANGIFTISQFFSTAECNKWIDFSEKTGYEEAKISFGKRQVLNTAIRNNERILYDSPALALELWDRLKAFAPAETPNGYAIGLNERFRFYKYRVGQQFRPHQDGSFIRNIHEWSSFTFMIYLNDNMEGGTTKFLNCEILPEQGKALIFKHELVHEGSPVLDGVKYVLRTDIMYRRKSS